MKATFHRKSWSSREATDSRPSRRYVADTPRFPNGSPRPFNPCLLSSTANQAHCRRRSDSGHELHVSGGQSLAGVQRLLENVRRTKWQLLSALRLSETMSPIHASLFLYAAPWPLSGCWLVNCFWGWPRRKYEQCVQKKEPKSSFTCRLSSHPSQ